MIHVVELDETELSDMLSSLESYIDEYGYDKNKVESKQRLHTKLIDTWNDMHETDQLAYGRWEEV